MSIAQSVFESIWWLFCIIVIVWIIYIPQEIKRKREEEREREEERKARIDAALKRKARLLESIKRNQN